MCFPKKREKKEKKTCFSKPKKKIPLISKWKCFLIEEKGDA